MAVCNNITKEQNRNSTKQHKTDWFILTILPCSASPLRNTSFHPHNTHPPMPRSPSATNSSCSFCLVTFVGRSDLPMLGVLCLGFRIGPMPVHIDMLMFRSQFGPNAAHNHFLLPAQDKSFPLCKILYLHIFLILILHYIRWSWAWHSYHPHLNSFHSSQLDGSTLLIGLNKCQLLCLAH